VRVERIRRETTPTGAVRLLADIHYESGQPEMETAYYEVPAEFADGLSETGNPWLALVLPAASVRNEKIVIDAPIDPVLREGATKVMARWREWYDHPAVVEIEAESQVAQPPAGGPRQAAFFSGGIDAYYTALDFGDGSAREERGAIDDLILVHGFDVKLYKKELLERASHGARVTAETLGYGLVDLTTNLHDTRLADVPWGDLAHGAALVSCALALEGRYTRILMPSSYTIEHAPPWGSHPEQDPLLSTTSYEVMHDAVDVDKPEKIEVMANQPLVQKYVRVCQRKPEGINCGRCEKCLFTALGLDVFVGLDECEAFDGDAVDLDLIRRNRIHLWLYVRLYGALRRAAVERGRTDVVEAIDHMMDRSVEWSAWYVVLEGAKRRRLLWPLVRPFKKLMRTGWLPAPPGVPRPVKREDFER